MRDSFVFYRSFYEAIKLLPKKYQHICFQQLCEYALNDKPLEGLPGTVEAILKSFKPQVDANNRRYENGLKGGRPKGNQNETKQKPKHNQNETKPKRNDNDNVNDNVNDNDNEKGNGNDNASGSDENLPLSLISYLNQKTGSSYKVDADITGRIISLFGQGYSVEDMRTVIDRKCAEWCDDKKMRS